MNVIYKKAFTLIELLVVIAIIALLSSVVLSSLNSSRAKSRDAARVQTIAQVKNALELYYSDQKRYPPSNSASTISQIVAGPLATYMKGVAPNLKISASSQDPFYYSDTSGTYYELTVPTESGGAFSKNVGCSQTTYYSISGTSKYCYGNNPAGVTSGGGGSGGSTPTLNLTKNFGTDPQSFTWSTTGIGGGGSCSVSADTLNFNDYNPLPSAGTISLPPFNENGLWSGDEGIEVTQITITMQCTSGGQSTPSQSIIFSSSN